MKCFKCDKQATKTFETGDNSMGFSCAKHYPIDLGIGQFIIDTIIELSLIESATDDVVVWDKMSQEKLSAAMACKIPKVTPLNGKCGLAKCCPYLIAPCEVCDQ